MIRVRASGGKPNKVLTRGPMALDLMSRVYSTIPEINPPECEVEGLSTSKTQIVNKAPKTRGLFANFCFNPFKKSPPKPAEEEEIQKIGKRCESMLAELEKIAETGQY